ncbi:pectate lyase-like protein [Marinimicrobium koreense]|uniref:Pectate lyase-like protein n=1 Tax=Marinimicrobium koreense TaxID=306545 RepID=A0A3N1NWQ1_9GAMM|nr:glycoside hydrolase family 28 protein [Marinimicrobium koreense]ROQ20625.1 pectate lyase-like protein [Marinimicrobium koreense]
MIDLQKRGSLKALGLSSCALGLMPVAGCSTTSPTSPAYVGRDEALWKQADDIIDNIARTDFPNRDFLVTEFGGKGDGETDNTGPIAKAIEACAAAGGGRVVIPAGQFNTGPVHLKTNINLHLQEGAVLSFYTDPERYKPYVMTRWEGVELMGYSPLIYAYEQENIAVTGQGVLEGNGSNTVWWPWKGRWSRAQWPIDPVEDQKHTRTPLFEMAEQGVPVEERVFEDNYLRPPFVQPYRCKRVLIEGVTIRNSPFWLLNPVLSEDVIVRGVQCVSHGPNSDGCDPESCNRVLIEKCLFDTGDDCIALKSGRNADGRRLATPIQNIVIQDCQMRAGHGGVVIGSEISGGARNVFARRCHMDSPVLDRAVRIKTNSVRGGLIENIAIRNIVIGQVKDVFVINFYYEEGDAGDYLPEVKDLHVSNMVVENAERVFHLRGFERAPISGVTLHDVTIKHADELGILENVSSIETESVSLNGEPLQL